MSANPCFRKSCHCLLSVLLVAIGTVSLINTTVIAHDGVAHGAGTGKQAIEVQQFAVETLRIPDVPVTDTHYDTQGFVSRFSGAGTLVISLTYTGCETLCPVTNLILQQLDKALSAEDDPSLQIVTLSIDPEQDTPDALRASAQLLKSSERWTWLTAAPKHSRLLLESLDVDVSTLEEHDPMFLVGTVSTGRFIRVIGMPDPDQLLAIARSEHL